MSFSVDGYKGVLADISRSIKDSKPRPTQFTASRYPFTYAYDYVRAHADIFGLPEECRGNRGAAGQLLRLRMFSDRDSPVSVEDGRIFLMTLAVMADAYCNEFNVELPESRFDILVEKMEAVR